MKLKDFLEGLTILSKYAGEDQYPLGAEHDEFFFNVENVSKKDRKRLEDLGWNDKDYGNWMCYL